MMPAVHKRQTILVIDDNITNLKVAVEHLKAYSFEILTARDGETGIQRALLARPDLILLDVQMPGIDGFETCRRLKANPATAAIPMIMMTVLSETADKVRGLEAGAVDYVTKPIDATEVLARVTTHLKVRALQEQLQQANDQLEQRVHERTAALEEEISRRTRYQEEKEGLLELLRQQSEQLRQMTHLLLERQEEQQGQLHSSIQQVDRDLAFLESRLHQARQGLAEPLDPSHPANQVMESIQGALAVLPHVRRHAQQVSSDLDQATFAQQRLRASPLLNLSAREYEVFQLLAQGKSNAEIADLLFLAKTTVSTYQRRIMEKLELADLPGMIKFAIQHNLVV